MEKIYGAIVILSLSLSHGKITIFLPFSGEKQRLFLLPLLGSSSEQTFFYTKGLHAQTHARTHDSERAIKLTIFHVSMLIVYSTEERVRETWTNKILLLISLLLLSRRFYEASSFFLFLSYIPRQTYQL